MSLLAVGHHVARERARSPAVHVEHGASLTRLDVHTLAPVALDADRLRGAVVSSCRRDQVVL